MEARRGDELRIALSMRGGVSLAVWIGGAVQEIDRLTRTRPTDWDLGDEFAPVNFYAGLLRLGGYERATIDVITGASAGGLNGVVLAASRAYGFPFAAMLPLWVKLGDIELLTRNPVSRRPQSLLRGDDYFQRRLRTELQRLVDAESGEAAPVEDPFDLILSATLVNPTYETTDVDPFAPLPEVRRGANFHFRYLGDLGDNGGNFQSREQLRAARQGSTVELLALAARATSSFPVAFEQARVGWSARRVFSDPPAEDAADQRVLDGGVLDNIPVTKAIEAIAAAPTTGRADRWLVFLHPSPSARTEQATEGLDQPASPQAFATLLVTVGAAFGQESLLDDLEELERHNAEAARQRLRRESLLRLVSLPPHEPSTTDGSAAPDPPPAPPNTLDRVALVNAPGNRRVRAQIEAVRAVRIITGEQRVGNPISPDAQPAVPGHWVRERERLASCIIDAYSRSFVPPANADVEPIVLAIGGLDLACDLVSGWLAGAVVSPEVDPTAGEASIGQAALQVSELRRLLRAARNWSDLCWHTAAAGGPEADEAWVDATVRLALDVTRFVPAAEMAALARSHRFPLDERDLSVPPGPAATADPGFARALDALDDVMRVAVGTGGGGIGRPVDLARWVWRRLTGIVETVGPLLAPVPAVDGTDPKVVEQLLVAPAPSGGAAGVLADLVVLLTQAQASNLVSDAEVRFIRITGNNATPLAEDFAGEGPFGVDQKLCGNELGNFAAFFSAKWRANDWMWGRMDAAKSLVDLVVRPERIAASALDAGEMVTVVRRLATWGGVPLEPDDPAEIEQELSIARASGGIAGDLKRTKELLTQAVQRRLFDAMEPVVARLGEEPRWRDGDGAVEGTEAQPPGEELALRMRAYNVGVETLANLRSTRRTQIGMRLAMVGYLAFKPLRRGSVSKAIGRVMEVFKPMYLFGAFAALNLARALFLVNMTAVGFWVGPWRYRGRPGHTWTEWFTRESRAPDAGWWHDVVRPRGFLTWTGVAVIVSLSVVSLVNAVRAWRKRRHARAAHLAVPKGLFWYVSSGVFGLGALIASTATGICTGPLSVMVGAGLVGFLTCLWMRNWARYVAIPFGVAATYALVGAAFAGVSALTDRAWFAYTGWMSVIALYAAQVYIAVLCTYTKVLHSEEELLARYEAVASEH